MNNKSTGGALPPVQRIVTGHDEQRRSVFPHR